MKKIMIMLALLLTAGIGAAQTQLTTESWAVGGGLSYPRYASINIDALNTNIGAYLSIQRNFTEHLGLRLKAGYSYMEGQYTNGSLEVINQATGLITGDLDVLFYPVPCEPVSPYLFAGAGGNFKMIKNPQTVIEDAAKAGAQLNLGAGVDFSLTSDLNLVGEFGYHITDGSSLEGTIVPGEVSAQDTYLAFTIGVNYLFGKGAESKLCAPGIVSEGGGVTQAMKDRINYNSRVIDKYVLSIANDKLVLTGVNFEFNKSILTPESDDTLDKTVKILKDKPSIKVEIRGYTDSEGSNDYNVGLSLDRAKAVRNHLISKGIDANRLTTVSMGQTGSVYDNKTEEGREMNRKVVLRIIK